MRCKKKTADQKAQMNAKTISLKKYRQMKIPKGWNRQS